MEKKSKDMIRSSGRTAQNHFARVNGNEQSHATNHGDIFDSDRDSRSDRNDGSRGGANGNGINNYGNDSGNGNGGHGFMDGGINEGSIYGYL